MMMYQRRDNPSIAGLCGLVICVSAYGVFYPNVRVIFLSLEYSFSFGSHVFVSGGVKAAPQDFPRSGISIFISETRDIFSLSTLTTSWFHVKDETRGD